LAAENRDFADGNGISKLRIGVSKMEIGGSKPGKAVLKPRIGISKLEIDEPTAGRAARSSGGQFEAWKRQTERRQAYSELRNDDP
jgi:hypothetical protein